MSTAFQVSLPPGSAQLPTLPATVINLLPFRLEYDGPAPISTYFMPRTIANPAYAQTESGEATTSKSSAQPPTIKIAAFRGRRVQAHELPLPQGYTGLILQAPPIPLPSDVDVPLRSRAITPRPSDRNVAELKHEEDASPVGLRRSPRKRNLEAATGPAKKGVDLVQMRKNARRKLDNAGKKSKFSLDSDDEENEDDQDQELPSQALVEPDVKAKASNAQEQPTAQDSLAETAAVEEPLIDTSKKNVKSPTPGAEVAPIELAEAILPDPPTRANPSPPPQAEPVEEAQELEPEPEPEQPLDLTIIRQLRPTATFPSMTIWSPDGPLDLERDEYVRGLGEWMRLSHLVHGVATGSS